jgi:DNA-binding LacI/PurR family transcriptional regulator
MTSTRRKTTRRATLQDIAEHAGVTVGTVSGILQGKSKERRISDEVTERVLAIAGEMDYAPNLLVRSLRHGHTHILSFFNGFRTRDKRDFYMDALTTAIERAGGSKGYDILVYCNFTMQTEEAYRSINGGNNDGLIFFRPQADDPLLPYLRRSNLPTVLLNATDSTGVLSSVTDDWQAGIQEVAKQLVTMGHRRIAAFGGIDSSGDAHDRVVYLNACLNELGVCIPDPWIVPLDAKDDQSAIPALRCLMSQPNPPTALFCWHDYVGYTVLEACESLGVSVPKQLSLVGYDGLRWPAKTHHTLASVRVDLDAMGEAAVEALVRLIESTDSPNVRRLMPVHFDAGTTLCPPQRQH